MNPIPTLSMARCTMLGGELRLTPTASSTSALPHLLVTDRLPCLAIVTPDPAATRADVVLTLNVLSWSPPVPHVSTLLPLTFGVIRTAFSRMTIAKAVISWTVSPFILSAVRKAPIWLGVASPPIISLIDCWATSNGISFRSIRS